MGDAKCMVGERQHIDVRKWDREKLLEPNSEFNWYWRNEESLVTSVSVEVKPALLILRYEVLVPDEKPEGKEHRQLRIGLGSSSCNYGGRRLWFFCPGGECNQRVAILYLENGAFVCRACASLNYECKRLDRPNRALRQILKIRAKLGGGATVTDPFPKRPKGMRVTTYQKLKVRVGELELKWDPSGLLRSIKREAPGLDPDIYSSLADPQERAETLAILEDQIRRHREDAREP